MPRRSAGRRTDYFWSNFGDVSLGQGIGGSGTFGSVAGGVSRPLTITRIRGQIGVTLDTGGAGESALILCGLMVLNGDAFTAGGAPEIFTGSDDEASWVWQGAIYVSSGAEAAVVPDALSAQMVVDSKAMRKVKPGQVLAFVHHSPAELATDQGGTYDLTYFFHCLNGS